MEFDKDLLARQEARTLARQAAAAQNALRAMTQEQLDVIVEAVAAAFAREAEALARMAVEETGFGNTADKTAKNRFASETVADAIRGMKAVGLSDAAYEPFTDFRAEDLENIDLLSLVHEINQKGQV